MSSSAIRKKFFEYFKKRGHQPVPSSSLIPDDGSVLLTTAGMQQFKPYFTGKLEAQKDFKSLNVVSIQKSFRTSDIDEVGDATHLTFFEMLGNFSFGGYFKKPAIEYAYEFITQELNLKIDYVSVFEGDSEVPADSESEEIWQSLGVTNIKKFGRADNFWGPTGAEGPCGPTTEIYVSGVEIWNIVFNEYYKKPTGELISLEKKGIDTGMGFERLMTVLENKSNLFETDLFSPIMALIQVDDIRIQRILADHLRAAVFLINDGVLPSNQAQGYILRRLIRRIIRFGNMKNFPPEQYPVIIKKIIEKYSPEYDSLHSKTENIIEVFEKEKASFLRALEKGLKEFEFYIENKKISGEEAFNLYQSYGFPFELTKELAKEKGIDISESEFKKSLEKHQSISRSGQEKKFGGHGLVLDTGELKAGSEEELGKVLRLHTATHLLQQALREVLGGDVKQAGSDITPERARFDFNYPRKPTPEEIKKVEDLVKEKIKQDLPVNFVELPKAEAEKSGALFFFKEKYPDIVKVYYVGESLESAWSKEFCGGPHVTHTGIIGEFKIAKEESIGSNLRRIRASVN